VKLRIKALLSLRLNYKWRGVWNWLKGAPAQRCEICKGRGSKRTGWPYPYDLTECNRCMGEGSNPGLKLGWERIWDEPQRVIDEQTAIAEGVMG